MNIEEITPDDVQRLFNNMSGAKATKDKAKIVLNQLLDAAVEDDLLLKNLEIQACKNHRCIK